MRFVALTVLTALAFAQPALAGKAKQPKPDPAAVAEATRQTQLRLDTIARLDDDPAVEDVARARRVRSTSSGPSSSCGARPARLPTAADTASGRHLWRVPGPSPIVGA